MVIGFVTLFPSATVSVHDGLQGCSFEHELSLDTHLLHAKKMALEAIHHIDKLKLRYVSL